MEAFSVTGSRWSSWSLLLGACLTVGCASFQRGPMPAVSGASYAEIDGTRLRFEEVGEGPVALLLHGFGSSIEVWKGLANELKATHRVVTVDLKGFGLSDRTPGGYSAAEQAERIAALMAHLGHQRYHVVGHSFGASVALALALAHPQDVDRIVLVSAWVYSDQDTLYTRFPKLGVVGEALFSVFYQERLGERFEATLYDPSVTTQEIIDEIEQSFTPPGTTAAAFATLRDRQFERQEGRYRELRHPTLLIWGREDPVARFSAAERLAMELRGAELKVYPRCGHFPMLEHRTRFRADVIHFLSRSR